MVKTQGSDFMKSKLKDGNRYILFLDEEINTWDYFVQIYKKKNSFKLYMISYNDLNDLIENNDYEIDEFSELLRAKVPGLLYGKYGDCIYLLDKNGNRITDIKDFDHSEPDADGYIYYPVPESDLIDGDPDEMLTPEACEKWRAKLGL